MNTTPTLTTTTGGRASAAAAPTPTAPTTPATPAVRLTGVTRSFGSVQAVRGIDLTIRRGEIVAFLGPNGAGKTTTIDLMLGLGTPGSGTVEVLGMAPEEAVAHGLVSAVMQTGGLLPELTVRESVAFLASVFPVHAGGDRVDATLARAGLTDLANRRVGKCSGGEQQRVRFAMALVSDPELLVLDEPTTGLDVVARREFWRAIRADAGSAGQGRTVLFATHYLEEADAYADRVVMVRDGRVVADGTPAEIRALGAGRVVRATWPGVSQAAALACPGVTAVDLQGETVRLHAADSDAVARYLLGSTPAHDVEITAPGLEDAFVALTGAA